MAGPASDDQLSAMKNLPLLPTLSALFLLLITLASVFAPWVTTYSYETQDTLNTLQVPSSQHWMGTTPWAGICSRV